MGVFNGKDCSVRIGTTEVVGIGAWTLSGVSADELDASDFNDHWMSYEFGQKDGGTLVFNGLLDAADTTGQEVLRYANNELSDITTLRVYINDTSYFVPNQTTGYFNPVTGTGADTVVSHVNITALEIGSEKNSLCTVSFTARVSGSMVLV